MIKMQMSFKEPVVNREASKYIQSNYNEILRQIPKFGVREDKAGDLLTDVYISIFEDESEGDGYDMNRGDGESCILVPQFVYGRIKKYALNIRYRTDVVDMKSESIVISSSCDSTEEYETLSSFQKAYAMASTYDDIETLEEELEIKEHLMYCVEFEDQVGVRMVQLFKNLDMLENVEFNKTLFEKLKGALKYHDEFADSFKSVLKYSWTNKENYDNLLAAM